MRRRVKLDLEGEPKIEGISFRHLAGMIVNFPENHATRDCLEKMAAQCHIYFWDKEWVRGCLLSLKSPEEDVEE